MSTGYPKCEYPECETYDPVTKEGRGYNDACRYRCTANGEHIIPLPTEMEYFKPAYDLHRSGFNFCQLTLTQKQQINKERKHGGT